MGPGGAYGFQRAQGSQHFLRGQGFRWVTFYLRYNAKHMHQYGHFKRQRGIGNSKTLEQALYCYKGNRPPTKNAPKTRMHVDAGSPIFNQVVRNVPVLHPRHQHLVSKEVREASLATMVGTPDAQDRTEKETQEQRQGADDAPYSAWPPRECAPCPARTC